LMGTVATAALAAGGTVVGVLPRSIADMEPPHDGLTELLLVDSMHERKAAMAERSDAFMALPGGLGTLEEVFETISWTQLGLQDKPTGFLNVAGFFDPLRAQLDRMVTDAFVRPEHRDVIYFDDSPARLLERLKGFEQPTVPKWIDVDAGPERP
ncbi:MAG: TIGR00730 family Rossman fold protein, partial [Streptosporangiaceae bacterium]